MPTSPRKSNKRGKDYLEEAVAKSTYHYKPITRRRAAVAALFGIPFGWMGIHNFMMRRRKRAALHFAISAIAISMFFYPLCYGISVYYKCQQTGECAKVENDDLLNVLVIIGLIAFALNIIWGIVESVIILININRFPSSIERD